MTRISVTLALCVFGLALISENASAGSTFDWFSWAKGLQPKKGEADTSLVPTKVDANDQDAPGMAGNPWQARRLDLDAIHAAKSQQASLVEGLDTPRHGPARQTRIGQASTEPATGRTRRIQLRQENKPIMKYLDEREAELKKASESGAENNVDSDKLVDYDDDDDDDDSDDDDVGLANVKEGGQTTSMAASLGRSPVFGMRSNKPRFAATQTAESDKEAKERLLKRFQYNQVDRASRPEAEKKKKSKSKFGGKNMWTMDNLNKKFKGALKATKKGLEATKKSLEATKQEMSSALDSVRACLWGTRASLLALIKEVEQGARSIRKEFSMFSAEWAPLMEEALDYLGDKNLNKVTWDDTNPLDLRRDALHSLVIGYEFMRMKIVWREYLLLAHEAFKAWLEGLMKQCDSGNVELERLPYSPEEVHDYMLLLAWTDIDFYGLEPFENLEYLMEITDARDRNYESKFFRNIVVLQEFYFPAIKNIREERDELYEQMYITSGDDPDNEQDRKVIEDQPETAQAYFDVQAEVSDGTLKVDVVAPEKLTEFMAMLTPQLRQTRLVYDKRHLKELKMKLAEADLKRQKLEGAE